MEITITLADTINVESRGQTVILDTTRLTAEIVARAAAHGLRQKIGDAAAGAAMSAAVAAIGNRPESMAKEEYAKRLAAWAKNEGNADAIAAEAGRMMARVRDAIAEGTWAAERQSAEKMDMAPVNYAISVYGAALARDIAGWSTMKAADRRVAANEWLDTKDGRRAAIVAKIEAERAAMDDI
jgi:hypothetical protein